MASNTPVPFQVVKSTAEKIAETIIPERVIVSDPVNKITVIGDGVTKGGVPFGASEQWNKFYAGTLEELQANPEALAALLKDAPANGLLFVVSEDIVNPDGTINEEELQAYLEENYLKLTGGTLTGILIRKLNNLDVNTPPSNTTSAVVLRVVDANNNTFTEIQTQQSVYGAVRNLLTAGCIGEDGEFVGDWCGLYVEPNGDSYFHVPDNFINNDAALNKKTALENFLPRTGGTLSGYLDFAQNYTVGETTTNSLYGNRLRFVDQTGFDCGALINMYTANGGIRTFMQAANKKSDGSALYSMLLLGIDEDGAQYSALPEPRGLHNNDGATAGWVMDYAPQKISVEKMIYVDPVAGSDTADLYNGRGESETKAFKTLAMAVLWVTTNILGQYNVNIQLVNDTSLTAELDIQNPGIQAIRIYGKTPATKLNTGNFSIRCRTGCLVLSSMTLTSTDAPILISSPFLGSGPNMILYSGLTIEGICTKVVQAVYGGQVIVNEAISGNVTGKRYECIGGGCIFTGGRGINAIPGSEAGTVDSSSIYA